MKWDIDKALIALEASGIAGTTLTRVMVSGEDMMKEKIGRITDEERAQGYAKVWCLALGKLDERKLFVYDHTIHSAYLKARKVVRMLSDEDLKFLGLRRPKKPGARARRS